MPVDFSLVPSSAAASATYIEQVPERRSKTAAVLPQKILFFAQYNTGKTPVANVPVKILSLGDIQTRAGRGSMAAIMYEAITRTSGAVEIFWGPLVDNAGGVVATKTLTVAVTTVLAGTVSLYVAGRKITTAVTAGMTNAQIATAIAAAITANLDCSMTAEATTNVVTLTARNKGLAPQGINIALDLESDDLAAEPSGVSIAIANVTAGTTDPLLATALGLLGDMFYTVIASPYNSAVTLAEIDAAWTTRVGPDVKRPFIAIAGYADTLANFTSALSARNSPGVTMVPVEGSPSHPWEIAAVVAGLLARNNDARPGVPVRGYKLTGVRTNPAYANWTGAQKDSIVVAGGSWTKADATGAILIGDLVTTYKTNAQGVADAGDYWRFTSTLSNIQAKIYSIDYLINSSPYINAVILDDASISGKSYVVRPKTLKADLIGLVDSWVENGWTKNRAAVVAGIVVEIDSVNPTRLNCYVPDVIAAGLRIIAARYGWSLKSAS